MEVTLTDNCVVSSRHITDEGFLFAKAIFSSVGIQQYKESEVFAGGKDDVVVNVFRSAETLSDAKFLSSLGMSPITKLHPGEFVSSTNYNALARGVICQDVKFENNDVAGGLLITDKNEIDEINQKGRVNVSLGYRAKIEKEAGIFNGQAYTAVIKDMRVNHAAIVPSGRCDTARILDKKGVDMSDKDKKDIDVKDNEVEKKLQDQDLVSGIVTQLLSNKAFMAQILQAVTKSPNLVKQLGAAIASQTTAPADGDETGDNTGDATGAATTPANPDNNQLDHKTVIDSAVIERVRLHDTAKNVFNMKASDFEDKSNRDIMIACLSDEAINDDTSDDFIKGRFSGMTEQRRNAVDALSGIEVLDGKPVVKDSEKSSVLEDVKTVGSAITNAMRGN